MKSTLYISLLREELLQRIEDNWRVLYAEKHGNTFDEIKSRNAFLLDLQATIEAEVQDKLGNKFSFREHTLSDDFLERFIYRWKVGRKIQSQKKELLSVYLGYENWKDFEAKHREEIEHQPITVNLIHVNYSLIPFFNQKTIPPTTGVIDWEYETIKPSKSKFWKRVFQFLSIPLLSFCLYFAYKSYRQYLYERPFTTEQLAGVKFNVKKYAGKVAPQMLQFEYDITSLGVDSASIYLDDYTGDYLSLKGDLNLRKVQGFKGTINDFPMYKPDFRQFVLLVNGKPVKTIHWVTPSNGWAGWITALADYVSPAVAEKNTIKNGILHFPPELIIDPKIRQYFNTSFVLVKDFKIDADSAEVSVRLKDPFQEGGISCFNAEIKLFANFSKNDKSLIDYLHYNQSFVYSVGREGCGSGLYLVLGKEIHWQDDKLTGLEIDPETWHILTIQNKNGVTNFYKDGTLVFSEPYSKKLANVVKLNIGFKGSGSVDWIKLSNSYTGKMVFFDDFER